MPWPPILSRRTFGRRGLIDHRGTIVSSAQDFEWMNPFLVQSSLNSIQNRLLDWVDVAMFHA